MAALIDAESRRLGSWVHGRSVLTSPIQRLPWGRSHVQQYLPLLPFAIEQIDLGAAEMVISSSHLVAKGVLTSPDQLHISYVHSPVRTPGTRCTLICSVRRWLGVVWAL